MLQALSRKVQALLSQYGMRAHTLTAQSGSQAHVSQQVKRHAITSLNRIRIHT